MPNTNAPQSNLSQPATETRASRKRLWISIVVGLIFAAMLFVAFLPTLMGSSWIYQPLVDRLKADDFQLQVGGVHLRWLSPLRLSNITLRRGTQGSVLVQVDQVQTDRGLLGYLLGGRKLGKIVIQSPTVDVHLLKEGTDLEQFVQAVDNATRQPDTAPDQPSGPPQFDIDVQVRNFSATVVRDAQATPLVVVPPLDLDVHYRAAEGASRVSIAPTKILDQVVLTPELVELGLGHAVPLLANSAWFDGRISLSVDAIDIPLATPELSTGKALLTLHQVRSGPNDEAVIRMLDMLAKMRRKEAQHELVFVDGSQIQIQVAEGRVHHEGLQFGLPKVDERLQIATEGSVGLKDRSLAMIVHLPIPLEQLARRDSVKQLGVPTLPLPIGGTLDKPEVRLADMRGDAAQLLGMIREQLAEDSPGSAAAIGALEGLAEGKADVAIEATIDLLKELRDRRREAKESDPKSPDSTPPPPGNRPIRDALKDLFRK